MKAWNIVAVTIGTFLTILGMYAAYQFAAGLDGSTSYLALAAPAIALVAGVLPPLAEMTWKSSKFKSILLWLCLIPAASVVFFSATERTHLAKAGAEAQRQAGRNEVDRAKKALEAARTKAEAANKEAVKAQVKKKCNQACEAIKLSASQAQDSVKAAEQTLRKLENVEITESELKMPPWLLGSTLDFAAFMLIWTGLTGPKVNRYAFNNMLKEDFVVKVTPTQKAAIKRHYAHLTLRFESTGRVMAQQQPGGAWGVLYTPRQTADHIATLKDKPSKTAKPKQEKPIKLRVVGD